MAVSKYFSYTKVVDTKRKWAGFGALLATVGAGVATFLPESYFLYKLKEGYQFFEASSPASLPDDKNKLFQTVLDDLNTPVFDRRIIKPFVVTGLDVFHAGSVYTRWGAIIGIPYNFRYKTTSDVDKDKIQVLKEKVDWTSTSGMQFMESLVFSEKAQKFAIGREICMVSNNYVYLKSIYPVICIYTIYALGFHMNNKFKMFEKPFVKRLGLYYLLSLLGITLWAFYNDMTQIYYETSADKTLCGLGKDYIEGAIEFYSKIIKRNVALRELMGASGENSYTPEGNHYSLLRTKTLPLTDRLQFVEDELQKLSNLSENE